MKRRVEHKEVDHPEFEVHNFHTLARTTGYSPHQLVNLLMDGVFSVLALRHSPYKSMFVVLKTEIAAIKTRLDERNQRIERNKNLMEQLKAARLAAKAAREALVNEKNANRKSQKAKAE